MNPVVAATLSLAGVLCLSGLAEETKTEMITKIYRVEPGSISRAIAPPATKEITGEEEFRPVGEPHDSELAEAVQKFFSDAGVAFPPGSSLRFDESRSVVVMTNTRVNHETLEKIVFAYDITVTQMEVKVHLFEGPPSKTQIDAQLQGTPQRLSGFDLVKSLTALESISVTTISGNKAVANRTTDQIKCHLTATPTLGPDGQTCNVTLQWEYQKGDVGLDMNTSVVVYAGEIVILRRDVLGDKSYVVALNVNLVGGDGKPRRPPNESLPKPVDPADK